MRPVVTKWVALVANGAPGKVAAVGRIGMVAKFLSIHGRNLLFFGPWAGDVVGDMPRSFASIFPFSETFVKIFFGNFFGKIILAFDFYR